MNAMELFRQIDQNGLVSVARTARIDLEDVTQQALMICAEIAAGQSTFSPALGTLEQFVFGKLWGFADRESQFRSENRGENENPGSAWDENSSPFEPGGHHLRTAGDEDVDPLSILLAREEAMEAEQARCAAVAAARRSNPMTALELCLAAGAAGAQTAQAMGRHRATGWRKRQAALLAAARLLGVSVRPD